MGLLTVRVTISLTQLQKPREVVMAAPLVVSRMAGWIPKLTRVWCPQPQVVEVHSLEEG